MFVVQIGRDEEVLESIAKQASERGVATAQPARSTTEEPAWWIGTLPSRPPVLISPAANSNARGWIDRHTHLTLTTSDCRFVPAFLVCCRICLY
jgi:hypothetical protein